MGNKIDDFGGMRLSTMQENGKNEVRKSGNRVSNDAITMDNATNDKYGKDNRINNLEREEGSMVSNLPLLFANGYPTSLEKITMAQLERFVLFMVHCSLGHDTTKVINKPEWWPQDIKFSSPLTRPKKINDNWMANLKKLVFRCYTYHRSEYLLRFCSYLAQYPHDELEYVNNWDSTTSLFHKSTGKLLVTFRNENMHYDRRNDSPRRTLLSHNASGNGNKARPQAPMMVQPCDDIYLCDNCDAEFTGLANMKEHEKICCEQDHGGCSGSRSSTPVLSMDEPELQQDQFLEYFQLQSNKTESKSAKARNASSPDGSIVRRTSGRVRSSLNFTRFATIPFSSPAGVMLTKKSKAMTEETQQERLDRIERHVIAPILSDSCRPKWLDTGVDNDRWIVTYKPNRDKPPGHYVHQYKFVNSSSSKPMLSIQSQLLYATCRPIYVVLTRLNERQINELKKDPSKYQCLQRNVNVRKVLLMRKAGPACKTRSRKARNASVSSKRKAPLEDDVDSTAEEEEEEEEEESNISASARETSTARAAVKSLTDNVETTKPVKEKKCSSRTIMLIDLCSSDEEENDLSTRTSCDENRDPMNTTESSIAKSFLRKLSPKLTLRETLHLPHTLIDRLVIE